MSKKAECWIIKEKNEFVAKIFPLIAFIFAFECFSYLLRQRDQRGFQLIIRSKYVRKFLLYLLRHSHIRGVNQHHYAIVRCLEIMKSKSIVAFHHFFNLSVDLTHSIWSAKKKFQLALFFWHELSMKLRSRTFDKKKSFEKFNCS